MFSSTEQNVSNYSLFALPVMFLLSLIRKFTNFLISAHWYSIYLIFKYNINGRSGWPNESPRPFFIQLAARPVDHDKKTHHTSVERTILRCQACHANGLENLPILGIALLAGTVAGLPNVMLNILAALYLVFRSFFNVFYIFVERREISLIRSLLFLGHICVYMTLFVHAGLALMQK